MQSDNVNIKCASCGHTRNLKLGQSITLLCPKCVNSRNIFSGDIIKDHYDVICRKCLKVFGIGAGVEFDVRKLNHCRMHIYQIKRSENKRLFRKANQATEKISDMPIECLLSNELNTYNIKKVERIALITTKDPGYSQYKFYPYISQKLRNKYLVYTFDRTAASKENLATLYRCDLAIGGVSDWMSCALSYRIPSIIIHTDMKITQRCEAAIMGSKKVDPNKILFEADNILSVPSLSYCIVTHNRYDKLIKCVAAILKYKKINEEIVIVDNGSNDDTHKYLKDLEGQKNIRIKYLKENTGCVIGRNTSMMIARGRNLFILDDDQIISANTLYNMRQVDADIVGTESWSMSGGGIPSKISHDSNNLAYVGAGGLLLPKRIAQELNYFDEIYAPGYYEDPDFCYRARKAGYKIKSCNSNIKHLGPGMDSILGADSAKIKNRNKEIFLKRWKKNIGINDKPSIIIVVDVPGWAWDIKTKNIIKYISNDFDITIKYLSQIQSYVREDYSLYFCYDFPFVRLFKSKPKNRIIGGVTAHTYTNFEDYVAKIKMCGAIHANSVLLYDEVKQINSNAFYVPNGVDENHFMYQPRQSGDFCVGYVGKSHDRKGYSNFIVPACQKAKIKLKSQTTKYNNPNVITPYEMPLFYHDVDCIIIASDMDGTPNQMLEAAATGRTFIGVPIGNVPEFCNKKNGFIVKRDIDEIVEKLVYLKEHRKECINMGIEARKTIEKSWSWEIQAENYRKMFHEVLNQ